MDISKLEIDKNSPMPYYYQLEWLIRKAIDTGQMKKGDDLPAVGDLAEQLNISVSVVRQALKRLESNGFLELQKGRKARITTDRKIQLTYIDRQTSLYHELVERGLKIKTRVLKKGISPANEDIGGKLEITNGQPVFEISRLRFVGEKPMIFWTSFLPYKLCPGIEKIDLKDLSLYEVLLKKYGLLPANAERSLEVVKVDKYEREVLKIPVDEPIVYIESITRTENNSVIEYYQAWHTASNWKFIINSGRKV